MKYHSTRGTGQYSFKDILFRGLAEDGGLFVPVSLPKFDINKYDKTVNYNDLAFDILSLFIGDDLSENDLRDIINDTYSDAFSSQNYVTYKNIDKSIIVELFNGPTLAFKDFAMQLLIPMFDHFLKNEDKRVNLIVATSGDTGSAAINAVSKSNYVNIYCLYPKNRISDFQRKQMSTIDKDNITLCEIDGTFDDCQNIVKSILSDQNFCTSNSIAAVNSINWARIAIQSVYYFYSYLKNNRDYNSKVNFSVPTGNFGDIYAGYVAKKLGLPIKKLVIATNENDILYRFMQTGRYEKKKVVQTTSPSMDIQIASNFERLLFDLYDSSIPETKKKMLDFSEKGHFQVDEKILRLMKSSFEAHRADQAEVGALIKKIYSSHGYLIDPHTAIGLAASEKFKEDNLLNFVLSTAHPVKFSKSVEGYIGKKLNLLDDYKNLFSLKESFIALENDEMKLKELINSKN
tara:strand:+ start:3983 stop:5362 length:1380 start_codon:yes stop_codon:yes gene_type:complete